jgi:CubicO group peptidase (beta-lactamase class C family)
MDPLPPQPEDVPWPTEEWSAAPSDSSVERSVIDGVLSRLFAESAREATGETHAVVLIHRGQLVAERYSPEHQRRSTFCSWSMAKSITHALLGVLVREGKLKVGDAAPVPEWQEPGDPRSGITIDHLLRMSDGLEFNEDYVDEHVSHVIEMLFGEGKDDVVRYAVARTLAHEPGSVWSYSSGTTNILSGILARSIGAGEAGMRASLQSEIFDRIGMRSAMPRFDAAGNFIASSFVFATARDFARFGLLYLRDGVWEGERLLPEGWVDAARTLTPASGGEYGAHWWLAMDGSGIFHASGYRGQFIVVDPRRDVVIVRLGASEPPQRGAVYRALAELDRAFPEL